MIKVLVLGAHAADVERQPGAQGIVGGVEVIVHGHRDKRCDIEILKAFAVARFLKALLDGFSQYVVLVRVHPYGEHAVGDLAGTAQPRGRNGGGVDGNIGRSENRLEGLAQSGGAFRLIRHLIYLPVELYRTLALEDLAHDLNVLLGARHGLAVGHTVPALDHLRT